MINIKEVSFEEAEKVHKTIVEFDKHDLRKKFMEKCEEKQTLITVAYYDEKPSGYMISYDKFSDGSLYCWMTGVNPKFRGKGILKKLMEHHEIYAKNKGYDKLKISTRNNRREMLSYLVKYGFNFTEVVPKLNIEDNRIRLEKNI